MARQSRVPRTMQRMVGTGIAPAPAAGLLWAPVRTPKHGRAEGRPGTLSRPASLRMHGGMQGSGWQDREAKEGTPGLKGQLLHEAEG